MSIPYTPHPVLESPQTVRRSVITLTIEPVPVASTSFSCQFNKTLICCPPPPSPRFLACICENPVLCGDSDDFFDGDCVPLPDVWDAIPRYLETHQHGLNETLLPLLRNIQILHQTIPPLRTPFPTNNPFQNPRHLSLPYPLQHLNNSSQMNLLSPFISP